MTIKELQDKIKEVAESKKHTIADTHNLIKAFIEFLGYDYDKDVDTHYSEDYRFEDAGGVDYIIYKNEYPAITIEAKVFDTSLRRFEGLSNREYTAKLSTNYRILTDGRHYFLFKDSIITGLVDDFYYYRLDLMNVDNNDIAELKKLDVENLNI